MSILCAHVSCVCFVQMDITDGSCLDLFPPASVVYLTPDAEEGVKNKLD